jgi:hypothetical protein
MKDTRRLLVFISQQQDLIRLLYDLLQVSQDKVSDKARAKTMLVLCRTFIFCIFTRSEFEYSLVHFCAILGIDRENNRLRRASDYIYILAGLMYDVRICQRPQSRPDVTAGFRAESKQDKSAKRSRDAKKSALSALQALSDLDRAQRAPRAGQITTEQDLPDTTI